MNKNITKLNQNELSIVSGGSCCLATTLIVGLSAGTLLTGPLLKIFAPGFSDTIDNYWITNKLRENSYIKAADDFTRAYNEKAAAFLVANSNIARDTIAGWLNSTSTESNEH